MNYTNTVEICNVIEISFNDVDIVTYHTAPQGFTQKLAIDLWFIANLILL
ncbi:hypothetical protein [Clostridium argentinense]|nr:hypothetical protein [Clostridium argentinense]